MQEIVKVYFSSFQHVIVRWNWWDTLDKNNVKGYHDSGILCINSKNMLVEMKDPYIFPKHYNQVFFFARCVRSRLLVNIETWVDI